MPLLVEQPQKEPDAQLETIRQVACNLDRAVDTDPRTIQPSASFSYLILFFELLREFLLRKWPSCDSTQSIPPTGQQFLTCHNTLFIGPLIFG